jgi:molecular chaperone DnaK (HSP70)
MSANIEGTIVGFKRILGKPFEDPAVQLLQSRVGYKIVKHEPTGLAAVDIKGQIISITEIASYVLKKLRDSTAAQFLEPASKISIGVRFSL